MKRNGVYWWLGSDPGGQRSEWATRRHFYSKSMDRSPRPKLQERGSCATPWIRLQMSCEQRSKPATEWLGSPIPVWGNPAVVGRADFYAGGPLDWTVVSERLLGFLELPRWNYKAFPLAIHEHPSWRRLRSAPYGDMFAPRVPPKRGRFSTGDLWVVEMPPIDVLDGARSVWTRKPEPSLEWPDCVERVEKYVFRGPLDRLPGIFRLSGYFGISTVYPWVVEPLRKKIEKAGLQVRWSPREVATIAD